MPEEATHDERREKFDAYIWFCLWLIPTTASLSALTWGLALTSDPFSVQDWLLSGDWGGDKVAMQSLMLVIALCLTIKMCMLMMTATYVAKHLGGLLYLCINLSKFVAWLLVIYGGLFLIAGVMLADNAMGEGKEILYTVAGLGVMMLLQSVFGILASKKIWDEPQAAVVNYKRFWPALVFTFFFSSTIFAAGGVYAAQIETTIDEDWGMINKTIDTSGADGAYGTADDLTAEEFVAKVTGSFRLVLVIGTAVSVYLLTGILTSAYVATRPTDVSRNCLCCLPLWRLLDDTAAQLRVGAL